MKDNTKVKDVGENVLEPEVLECYGHAWNQMWPYFGELFLILLISSAIYFAGRIIMLPVSFSNFFIDETNLILIPIIAFCSLLYIAFMALLYEPVQVGIAYANLKASRGEKLEIKDMFAFSRNYWNIVLALILSGIIVAIGLIFLIVPGIILACKLAFVPYLVIDRNMQATDAIKESWGMTDGHAWKIFLMGLLAVPIILGGLLCLIFGVIISAIWINLAFASLYYAVSLEKG
jgi:uncharacterized membrane protein